MYNFIHGYPTDVVGSWLPLLPGVTENGLEYELLCGNGSCYTSCEGTWEEERCAGASWPGLVRLECSVCAEHRQLRGRL